jgi:phenylacetate-CoA ligase
MTTGILEQLRRWRRTIVPLPVKYGGRFREVFRFLQEHQKASRDEIAAFQWRRLQELLHYAYAHVPFYRRRFDAMRMHPSDIATREDFRKIPYLNRDEVMEYVEELKSDEFDSLKPVQSVTSGTSRDHLRVFRSADAEVWRKAIMWRHFFNIGYRFRDRRAQFVGTLRFLKDHDQMPIDYNENLLMIEQFSIRPDHAPVIYKRMKEFAPKLIYCQPANLSTLILFFEDQQLEPFHVPIVYLTGEMIYPQYRRAIESFLGSYIVDYYGNRENTVAAVQLSDGRKYIQSEYCFMEFVDQSGREVVEQPAEIVATSLVNYAFPLIRYHTDDLGIYHGYPSGAVANYPVMTITGGRGKDLILTRRGLMFPQIEFKEGAEKFQRVRVEQKTLEHLHVTYVPTKAFTGSDDEEYLLRIHQNYFGNEFQVTIERVPDIPLTPSGKNKLYVSQLAMDFLRKRQS